MPVSIEKTDVNRLASGTNKDRGAPPAYLQIEAFLRKQIAAGVFAIGSQLPTEEEISEQFSVSRHTVRAALQGLVSEGLVERFPGRGSFIAKPGETAKNWAARSLDDILERSFRGDVRILSIDTIKAASAPEAAVSLQAGADDRLFRVKSVRVIRGVPITYVVIHVPEELSHALPENLEEELKAERLLHIIERANDIRVETLRQTSSACLASPTVAKILKLRAGSVLLQLRNVYLNGAGKPIETSVILCSPDHYVHTIELHRK